MILSTQYKNNAFRLTKNFHALGNNEGLLLNSSERFINVVDIPGFGRLSTPICVDFLTPDNFVGLVNMEVNLCLVPAFSESSTAFQTNAMTLGDYNYGSVFVGNCCSPVKAGKEMLFYYLPFKFPYNVEADGELVKIDRVFKTSIHACTNKDKCFTLPQCYYLVSLNNQGCKSKRVCYNENESKLFVN